MEIVGTVAPDEVPEGKRRVRPPGVWGQLAERVVQEHSLGRVVVVKLKDEKEYKTMRNNLAPRLRAAGFKLRPVVIEQKDELRVFLELALREDAATAPVNSHAGEVTVPT
jgi:hypothetical protein